MSFLTAIIITGVGLVVLTSIVSVILFRFKKKRFSYSFALSHLIFVAILSAIYFPSEKDAQHQLFWILPAFYDLPISLVYPLLALGNMIFLSIIFATLGTVQYAIIGWGIDLFFSKNKKELIPSKRFVISLFIFIGILTFSAYRNYSYITLSDFEKSQIELKKADSEIERFYALNDAAKKSFEAKDYDKARSYAQELLLLAQSHKKDWNYGNAIYDSHIVLGRLDLLDNNIKSAQQHLFSAVQTPGSPQLDSFGPNMTLAKDFLERGDRDTVIDFLFQCKKFWEDHEQIDKWVREIKEGKIPDFGANLAY